MNINWMSPAQWQAVRAGCLPVAPRNTAFVSVTAVTMILLAQGVPGDSLPAVLLALAVLTVIVSGGPTLGSVTAVRTVADTVAGLLPRGPVTA